MPGPRADRAQNRHLAAAFVKAGENRREHAYQPRQYDEQRDHEQRLLGGAHQAPQLLQRDAGEDCQQRFAAKFVDLALQAEGGDLAVQAEHDGGDLLGLQVHRPRLLSTDLCRAACGHAVLPVDMQGLHAGQGNMQGAVHRCAGALEDADHLERFVVMLDQADGGHAMGQHQLLIELVVERLRHFRAEHHFERVIGKGTTTAQLQRLAAGITVVFEIRRAGAHHPVATVRIAE